jgi:carbonic anhydrase/acetyltransferase-like protein (isoleucine patch superfamily)
MWEIVFLTLMFHWGSGTKTGNLRLDEKEIVSEIKGEKVCSQKSKLGAFIGKNVRVGINTSIMPGVKIGGGSFIGAHFLCDSDIPEKKFTYQKTPVVSKKNQTSSFIRKI